MTSLYLLATLFLVQPRILLAFFCHELLAHSQLVCWSPKVLLSRAAFQLVSPQNVPVPGAVLSQMQDYSQRYTVTQEVEGTTEIKEIPFKHKTTLFYCKSGQILILVVQRDCGASTLEDTQSLIVPGNLL